MQNAPSFVKGEHHFCVKMNIQANNNKRKITIFKQETIF
jgi:hypothetical protein